MGTRVCECVGGYCECVVCACLWMHVCVPTLVCFYGCMWVYDYVNGRMHVWVCVYMCVCGFVCVHMCVWVHEFICVFLVVCAHVCVSVHV